jgi:polar amino acid transport system substrate-binding protein
MNKTLLVIIFSLSNLKSTLACNEITFSAHPNYPPFHWYDGKKMKGASIESFKEIFKGTNIKVKPKHLGPWNRVLSKAEKGSVDVVVSLKNSSKRTRYLQFTNESFYSNPFSVFKLKSSNWKYKKWSDLKKKDGLFNAGDSFGNSFDQFLKKNLSETRTRDISQAFNLLIRKRYQYYVTGYHTGISHINSNKEYEDIEPILPFIEDDYIYHGFSLKSKCLMHLSLVNKRLKEMRETGRTKELIEKYQLIWKNDFKTGKIENQ